MEGSQLSLESTQWQGAPWTPRRWQAEALDAALVELDAQRNTVISAVMGSGKSILIAQIAARRIEAGDTTILVTTPTRALVEQLAGTLKERLGADVVGRYYTSAKEADRRVIVACNASGESVAEAISAIGRQVDTWIADEVHKTETQQILDAHRLIQPTRSLGLTATPYRSQEKQRLSLWESVAYRYSLGDALKDRVLVPWKVRSWDGKGNDDLDEVCWRLICDDSNGPGMINAASIADAESFVEFLGERGWKSAAVHSRQRDADNTAALAALEAGDLRAVVHVNMLAEGVDLPWLRWLCLRRPVGAKVRFQQEVGRVLRSCLGKSEAVLYDPHDLFGIFGWHYTEAIGEWDRAAKEAEATAHVCGSCKHFDVENSACVLHDVFSSVEDPSCDEWSAVEGEGEPRTGLAIDPISAWCRRLLLPLQASGLSPSDKIASISWRRDNPSEKQVEYLRRLSTSSPWGYLPGDHGGLVTRALEREAVLTRGAASDLISIAKAVLEHEQYPEDSPVDPPPDSVWDASAKMTTDPRWYAAGAYKKTGGTVALVVFHDGRIAEKRTRPKLPNDDWVSVQVEAAALAAVKARMGGEQSPEVAVDAAYAAKIASGQYRAKTPAANNAAATCRGARVVAVKDKENPARAMGWRVLARSK